MMKFKVKLEKQARKALRKIDIRYKRRILKALVRLRINPYKGKSLSGDHKGYYSVRVWPYRIIYEIDKDRLLVVVVRIRHRQSAYKISCIKIVF